MALGAALAKVIKNPTFIDEKDRYETIKIQDIPILLCEDGSICCIPKEEEVFSSAVVGSSGTGKTLIVNRIVSHLFYQWKDNVALLNDVSEETYKWSEPMDYPEFNLFNETYLNQSPCPSPLVYVYPKTNTLEINKKMMKNKNYVKIVLPFEEILNDIGFYLNGVNPEFELGKSAIYIRDLNPYLIECETTAQIREVLNEQLPGSDGKSFKAMRVKIMTAFDSLFREEILDITNPECHSNLKLENSELDNPFITLMKAKTIPTFITSDLANKKYSSQVFAYHINTIFNKSLKEFENKTYLVFDELRTVCEKDDEPAAKAIGSVSARGRINNVGLIYATQFYDKIPNCVKGAKLTYLFAFSHNSSKILNEIGSDFDLDKKTKEIIKKLRKYEVIAMTNNKFVFYRDGERWEDNKPVKGRIFYPLANHRKAGEGK